MKKSLISRVFACLLMLGIFGVAFLQFAPTTHASSTARGNSLNGVASLRTHHDGSDTLDRLHRSILGAWDLTTVGAPIDHHLLTFVKTSETRGVITSYQADGVYPDAESTDVGVYEVRADGVHAAFVTLRYDKVQKDASGRPLFLGRAYIYYVYQVHGDTLTGNGEARVVDANGTQIYPTAYPTGTATRIVLP